MHIRFINRRTTNTTFRSSGMTMVVEAVIRKAEVQAAVVWDDIRDGYDFYRVLVGKVIWEKIG